MRYPDSVFTVSLYYDKSLSTLIYTSVMKVLLVTKKVGTLFIMFGPSGSGKTTLLHQILEKYPTTILMPVITYTTRPMRPNEIQGKDYYFIGPQDFCKKLAEGYFIHTTTYLDKSYGAPKTISEQLSSGQNLIAIFDRAGAIEVKNTIPNSVLIWVTAPLKDLQERLLQRYQNNSVEYKVRFAQVNKDIELESISKVADYEVINIDLKDALQQLENIINKFL